ncbi:MAG: DASH family cryptochrome [Bacterioplanes sp.]|nr:DASH family cryptochrome [Bacterioplanes sp.]
MNVLWLRNDLRLHDHPGFQRAQADACPLSVVYILPQHWLEKDEHGLNRLSLPKARFLRACLIDLHRALYLQNIQLHILYGDPVELLQRWHRQHAFTLLTHSAQAPEERQWLAQLQQAHIECVTYDTQTLLNHTDIAPILEPFPATFNRFRRAFERDVIQHIQKPTAPVVLTQHSQDVPFITSAPWPNDFHPYRGGAGIQATGGEQNGLSWLNRYLWQDRGIAHYKTTRNQLLGTHYASQLSPYLAWGCLSVRQVWYEIVRYEQQFGMDEHSEWLRMELLWREFFHWSMRHHADRLFQYQGLLDHTPPVRQHNSGYWQAWCTAETGMPMIDAGLLELQHTGFLSNRLRQILASYFVHELGLDWRLGARYFEQQLIDFDVASNWGNWAYLAGVGHDPRSQNGEGRYFNINKQLQQYDPDVRHIHTWLTKCQYATLDDIQRHQAGGSELADYPSPIHLATSNRV